MQAIEPWHSFKEISRHLGVSKETIYRWLVRGRIRAHRMDKLWKFKPSEGEVWVLNGDASDETHQRNPSESSM